MNANTRFGLGLLGTAMGLGILFDTLLRGMPWGLNVTVLTVVVALAIPALARWGQVEMAGGGRWLLLPMVAFGVCFAWRDSLMLKVCDALAILVAVGLAGWRSRRGQVRIAGMVDYALGLFLSALNCVFGVVLLVCKDIEWKAIPRAGNSSHFLALARGLLIALPLLLLFGGLFMAADAGFEHFVNRIFHFDAEALISHAFLIGFFTWTLAGFLRHTLERGEPAPPLMARPQMLSLGIVELGTVLGLLDLLFLAFVGVQVGYLFGGRAHLFAIRGLTAADYARRGFFELVAIAALSLALLLLAEWLLKKDSLKVVRVFRGLSAALIGLTFAVMFSAGQRMWLYYVGFGLTETRFYVSAFMVWMVVLFAWFGWTVLRGKRERFVFGAMLSAFGLLGALHVLNPDAFIVHANVSRQARGRTLDINYVLGLSADATPALVAALPHLPVETRVPLEQALMGHEAQATPVVGEDAPDPPAMRQGSWPSVAHGDWRSWSWGRFAAYRALKGHD